MDETVAVADAIDRGRESFRRRAWGEAFALLSSAELDSRFAHEDLERLAVASYLVGRLRDSGELARGGGWVHRAERLVDDGPRDSVENGYVRYCASLRVAFEGDVEAAHAGFAEAATIADRFRQPELVALARVGQG